jgi:hypothetical protein
MCVKGTTAVAIMALESGSMAGLAGIGVFQKLFAAYQRV